jgi:hypothetical protein
MSERQQGSDQHINPEVDEQRFAYRQVRRFPDEPTSSTAYEGVRQTLYEMPCDLSTYRAVLLPDTLWHVLVLGATPDAAVRERIEQSLMHGEAVELPDEVWAAFRKRRLEQLGDGQEWVEQRLLRPRRL